MAGQTPSQERSLRDFYSVLFHYQRLALSFLVLVMVAVLIGNTVAPKVYLSEAKLMVRLGRESVSLDPTATTGQVMNVGQDRESEINSEIEILKSQELLERLVDRLEAQGLLRDEGAPGGLGKRIIWLKTELKNLLGPAGSLLQSWLGAAAEPGAAGELKRRSRIVERMRKAVSVQAVKKSSIIGLSYQAQSPALAQQVLAGLVDLYLEKHISVYRTAGSHQFFKEQTESLGRQIETTEARIREIKNAAGMASLEEQRRVLIERLASAERDYDQTGRELAASRAKAAMLEDRLRQLPKTQRTQQVIGFPESAREELRKSISNLQLREQELLATFTEQSIQVQELRRQIREARALYAALPEQSQVTQGINAAYQQTDLALLAEQSHQASLEARYAALGEQVNEARAEVVKLNDVAIELARLERELELHWTNFRKYADSLEQTRIDQALETEKISNISLVQPASYPVEPIRPRKLMNLAIGLVLGVLGGIGLAFLADHQDHTLKLPEDVERHLQLPVWATIADWRQGSKRPIDLPAASAEGPAEIGRRLGTPAGFGRSWDALWDAMSAVEGTGRNEPRTCAVTAWRAGEGATTTAVQLARTLVRREQGRVLLVDANVAEPRLHALFDVREGPGLADMLVSGSARVGLIQATGVTNLDLLSCGSAEARQELLGKAIDADLMRPLLETWEREYRLVVFDVPPLSHNGQSAHWLHVVDAAIWVIEAEGVRREVLQSGHDRLHLTSNRPLGVVLNKRRFYIPGWLYGTL